MSYHFKNEPLTDFSKAGNKKAFKKALEKIKDMMADQNDVKLELQGVYGVYDILVKLSSDDSAKLRSIVTNDIRKIENVQSTLTMMVIEQQEKS